MATFFLLTIFLAFVSLGLPDSIIGVAWPHARLELFASTEFAGYLSVIITAFTMLSSILSLRLVKRLGTNKIVAISCLMTGLMVVAFGLAQNKYLLLLICIPLGLGAGAVDAVLNDYVAQHYSSKIMNWLHACWGIGALTSPLIITAFINIGSWRLGLFVIGGVQIALAILFFSTLSLWKKMQTQNGGQKLLEEVSAPHLTMRNLAPWLSVLLYFFYVGVEASLGLWLNTLLFEHRGMSTTLSGVTVSVYYTSIMGGRMVLGFFSNKLGNTNSIRLGIIFALIGAILLFIPNHIVSVASVFLIGWGFAPIYPATMHETARRFNPTTARKTIGYQMAAASFGAMTFSPIIGFISSRTSMEVLVYTTLLGIFILAIVSEWLVHLTKKRV